MIYVVGTGPGALNSMTEEAKQAILRADIVVGYKTYLEQISGLLQGIEVISSNMMQEVERCEKAFELAQEGKTVVLVSGGDAGIYAMAGLVLEMASTRSNPPELKIIPGVAAINGCAARLGAPLMHDFCAISLSDLLTPWNIIVKRLQMAAEADFVIALYNPKSKKRTTQIVEAQDIIMKYRAESTPVGIVTGASRENETVVITDLAHMLSQEIGMQSTVIIGNSTTFTWNNFMITPRGYKDKYSFKE